MSSMSTLTRWQHVIGHYLWALHPRQHSREASSRNQEEAGQSLFGLWRTGKPRPYRIVGKHPELKMRQWWKEKRHHIFDRSPSIHAHQTDTHAGPTSAVPASIPTATVTQTSPVDGQDSSGQKDLWQCAYGELEPEQQDILSKVEATTRPEDNKHHSKTEATLNRVIQITEEQYKEYQQGGIRIQRPTGEDIDLRKVSRKILDASLSFKDVISAIAGFDPTKHAASAWAVVSLGLTVGRP